MKYEPGLAVGVIAAGAMLGPIIPPSMSAVMFGILANASIGKLFIAGILPGVLLLSCISFRFGFKPGLSP